MSLLPTEKCINLPHGPAASLPCHMLSCRDDTTGPENTFLCLCVYVFECHMSGTFLVALPSPKKFMLANKCSLLFFLLADCSAPNREIHMDCVFTPLCTSFTQRSFKVNLSRSLGSPTVMGFAQVCILTSGYVSRCYHSKISQEV